jgi:hypothetical protein
MHRAADMLAAVFPAGTALSHGREKGDIPYLANDRSVNAARVVGAEQAPWLQQR